MNKIIIGRHAAYGPYIMHYKNGKIDREDGPAIEYFDGFKSWYKEDWLYRADGPNIINPNLLK